MDRRIFLSGASAIVGAGLFGPGVAFAQTTEGDAPGIVEMAMGAEDAPITIVEYASYTCPHCANFHATSWAPLKSDFIDTGKVRFIYREVYFDRFGLWASLVARCAGEDRFFGVTDMLYEQQKEWLAGGDPAVIAQNLRRIGKLAGLTEADLDKCLTDEDQAKALVAWYQENATRDDINSTPTFMIDGEQFANMAYKDLKALLDKKLDA